MTNRHFLPSMIWFALALVMFVGAAVLTRKITAVHSHFPKAPTEFGGEQHKQALIVGYRNQAQPPKEVLGVHLVGPDGNGPAEFNVWLPAKADVVLAVGNLVENSCVSSRDYSPIGAAKLAQRPVRTKDPEQGRIDVLFPKTSTESQWVHCLINLPSSPVTYVRKELYVSAHMDDFLTSESAVELAGYTQYSDVEVTLNLIGADKVSFSRGSDITAHNGDATGRLTPQGSAFIIEWANVYAEQWRDIWLIVIGSLIAIGVTMAIEAVRPFVDNIGKLLGLEKQQD